MGQRGVELGTICGRLGWRCARVNGLYEAAGRRPWGGGQGQRGGEVVRRTSRQGRLTINVLLAAAVGGKCRAGGLAESISRKTGEGERKSVEGKWEQRRRAREDGPGGSYEGGASGRGSGGMAVGGVQEISLRYGLGVSTTTSPNYVPRKYGKLLSPRKLPACSPIFLWVWPCTGFSRRHCYRRGSWYAL